MKIAFGAFVALICLLIMFALFVFCIPLTVSISFDDGIESHYTIAAPLIEDHGWLAAFNVPTQFMDPENLPIAPVQAKDLAMIGHESDFMTWNDLRVLRERGHEIYPHTLDHTDFKSSEINVESQIVGAKADIVKHLGFEPKFYCAPHNNFTKEAEVKLHMNKMQPLNWRRKNWGASYSPGKVRKYLLFRRLLGIKHIDMMLHGIAPEFGGWQPFRDIETFGCFLDELKQLEDDGVIKIVLYSQCHAQENNPRYWVQCFWYTIYDLFNRRSCKSVALPVCN